MKVTPDTNVLVRAIVQDHEAQTDAALKLLETADLVALSATCLSEVAWVLRSVYGFRKDQIAAAVDNLLSASNVVADRSAMGFGLDVMAAGADFADGLIAWDGEWRGGETFVSFDRKAVAAVQKQGRAAEVLTTVGN